ncbi:MAG TPA: hypothetical protein VMK82_08520, partial [Steroidobacteraceae bacterium]|nr:hypothetical protein [Steroidobacteraceae bacterium]
EPVSSTYTYLLGCAATGKAVLIDPVMPAWQREATLKPAVSNASKMRPRHQVTVGVSNMQ